MMTPEKPDEEFSTTKIIDAPRELVFQLWTDPIHFLNWWWPKEFKTELKVKKLDNATNLKFFKDVYFSKLNSKEFNNIIEDLEKENLYERLLHICHFISLLTDGKAVLYNKIVSN